MSTQLLTLNTLSSLHPSLALLVRGQYSNFFHHASYRKPTMPAVAASSANKLILMGGCHASDTFALLGVCSPA